MKPILKPDTPLHCQDPKCGYADETWRFSAHGGDDVTYRCPKCKTVAGMSPPEKEEEETVKLPMKNKFRTPAPTLKHPVPEMPPFFAVSYDGHKLFGPIPASEIDNVSDDIDLIIPILENKDIEELDKRDGKKFEQFRANVADLVDAIREGAIPYTEEVISWLTRIGAIEDESPEIPMVDVGGDRKEFDEDALPPMAEEYIVGFEDGFGHGYSTGFQRGFQQAVGEMMAQHQEEPEDDTPDVEEVVPIHGSPPEDDDPEKQARVRELLNKANSKRSRRRKR